MAALSMLGFGAFVVASAVVGLRLLALAGRTRELPELCIGLALFLGGGIAYALVQASLSLRATSVPLALVVAKVGLLSAVVGTLALHFANWRIYRPAERGAAVLFCFGAALTALAAVLVFTTTPGGARNVSDPVYWALSAAASLAYAWSAAESLRYHGLLRRRERIGLADPELADRFRLWGGAASGAVAIYAIGAVNRLLVPVGVHPIAMAIQSCVGLVVATAIWLAFFPPEAYRRRFARSAPLG